MTYSRSWRAFSRAETSRSSAAFLCCDTNSGVKHTIRASLFSLFVVLLVGVASTAFAQDARERFRRGQTAYQQGDYEGAIREWTAAYQADPRPLLQYNLAQAYERLGRLTEARQALENYVAHAASDDTNQSDARARLSSLRERLSHTGVRVSGGPEGASILIDGHDWGRTPRPDMIAVEPGTHRLIVRLAGYQDFNATMVVPAGQTVDMPIEMTANPTAVATPAQAASTTVTDTPPVTGSETPIEAPRHSNALPIALMVGGGAVAVTGLVVGIIAVGKASDAPASTGPEARSARTLGIVADIGMGVGIVTAGVGLVLLLVGGSNDDERPASGTAQLSVTPVVSQYGAGASATLNF
jgi:hypothetical protein